MTKIEIENRIIRILNDDMWIDPDVKPDEITAATDFHKDLNFDSLDDVELVMELWVSLGTNIPDEDAEKLHTVAQVVEYIHSKIL